MKRFILNPTDTSQWHALVNEAQMQLSLRLHEELESYLVFMLIRFTQRPELTNSVVGREYLVSQLHSGLHRQMLLRDVGDKCLLFSGLFPGNAQRRHVDVNYFVKVGQSAYSALSTLDNPHSARLYSMLSNGFVDLMDVLQTLRDDGTAVSQMHPKDAVDLWRKQHSRAARMAIEEYNNQELLKLFKKLR